MLQWSDKEIVKRHGRHHVFSRYMEVLDDK